MNPRRRAMQSVLRMLAFGCAFAIRPPAPVVRLMAQASDPAIGTWKLIVAKSRYAPGPAPKSLTLTFEAAGQGIKLTTTGVDAQGNPTRTEYTANYDGKDQPIAGSRDYDTVSLKRVNARTVEVTRKKGGKVVQTVRRVLSRDGKHLTVTTTGTNAAGQRIHSVAVFEKQ